MWHLLGWCPLAWVAFASRSEDGTHAVVTVKTTAKALSADISQSTVSSIDSQVELNLGGAVVEVSGMPWGENLKGMILKNAARSGVGSFGEVWQLKNVALKFFHANSKYLTGSDRKGKLSAKIDENKNECSRTRRMVSTAQLHDLEWQHICDCYEEHISDAGWNDPVFIVMQDCGQDLDTAIRKRQIKTLPEVRHIIKQILKAVGTLSTLNYVHHDLKPANVAYDVHGIVRLIDFGGLLKFDPTNPPREWALTRAYAPPESRNAAYDVNADASAFDGYATGLIYWQLLCQSTGPPKVENVLSCSSSFFGRGDYGLGMAADFDIISGLTQKDPRKRLKPHEALNKPALWKIP